MDDKILEFQKLLQKSKNIAIINHRRMDGDAFGSLSAFYYILKKLNYNVIALNDEKTPSAFDFLKKEEIFQNDFDGFIPDVIISFDAAGIEQLGEIYLKNNDLFHQKPFVVIDHHISNPGFGSLNIINTNASSTCEIVFYILKKLGLEKFLDSQIASFLLMGIITDTNSFFNTNSGIDSFNSAGELMGYNPRHQDIIINLFKKKPYNRIKLWGNILEGLKDIANGKIVWNIVPKSLFIETQTTNNDISGLVDEFLMTIDGLEVGFLLYEMPDGKVKGSFRAKSDLIDLSIFCANWGGGGHKRASGFLLEGKNIYEVEQEVISKLLSQIN